MILTRQMLTRRRIDGSTLLFPACCTSGSQTAKKVLPPYRNVRDDGATGMIRQRHRPLNHPALGIVLKTRSLRYSQVPGTHRQEGSHSFKELSILIGAKFCSHWKTSSGKTCFVASIILICCLQHLIFPLAGRRHVNVVLSQIQRMTVETLVYYSPYYGDPSLKWYPQVWETLTTNPCKPLYNPSFHVMR